MLVPLFLVAAALVADRPFLAPFETEAQAAPRGRLDQLVSDDWQRQGVQSSYPASDPVFLRRVYLDTIGALPTADETAAFLASRDPEKRAALIDGLLARDEFARYWALKWGDLLRIKSEFPINLWPNAVQAYAQWVRAAVRENVPYDRFARQLLVSNGSNFRVPEVNFYRAVESRDPPGLAQAVALTFMGTRTATWPKAQLDGMAAFFSQVAYKGTSEWKEEIVYFDPDKPRSAATFPDGKPARIAPGQDPRTVFADWLISDRNPWFARAIVNRVWYWLMGRGIVQEPDDIRPDNPAANPELLRYLEQELTASHYDLKHIYRLILNSQVYQLSSIPREVSPAAAAHFAHYPLRRLDAEVLIDAIDQVTGSVEDYSSPIPEPFTYLPDDQLSVDLEDGSIGSAFLDMFGRPARDSGLVSERNNQPTANQRLHLLNSSHIQLKIQQGGRLQTIMQARPGGKPRDPIDRLYLTILSRYPTDQELAAVSAYFQSVKGSKSPAAVDLAWSLINSTEFLCRH